MNGAQRSHRRSFSMGLLIGMFPTDLYGASGSLKREKRSEPLKGRAPLAIAYHLRDRECSRTHWHVAEYVAQCPMGFPYAIVKNFKRRN